MVRMENIAGNGFEKLLEEWILVYIERYHGQTVLQRGCGKLNDGGLNVGHMVQGIHT